MKSCIIFAFVLLSSYSFAQNLKSVEVNIEYAVLESDTFNIDTTVTIDMNTKHLLVKSFSSLGRIYFVKFHVFKNKQGIKMLDARINYLESPDKKPKELCGRSIYIYQNKNSHDWSSSLLTCDFDGKTFKGMNKILCRFNITSEL